MSCVKKSSSSKNGRYHNYRPLAIVWEFSRWVQIRTLLKHVQILTTLLDNPEETHAAFDNVFLALMINCTYIFNETKRFPQTGWYIGCECGYYQEVFAEIRKLHYTGQWHEVLPMILPKMCSDIAKELEVYSREDFEDRLELQWVAPEFF